LQRGLHEERAEATGGAGHQHGVTGTDRRLLHDAEGGPPGADHRDRLDGRDVVGQRDERGDGRERVGGVPPAERAQVRDHPAAEPRRVAVVADRIHHARDLPAGRHRQLHAAERARLAGPQRRVEEVHPSRFHRDADLLGGRFREGEGLGHQHLGTAVPALDDRLGRHGRQR
jgi:hypothetical protein